MKRTSSGGVGTSKLGAFLKMLWLVLVVRKSTKAFYDSIGDGYDTLVGGQPDSEDACDFLEDYATEQGVELRSVLEAGCGTGLYSRHLEGICDELHGLDYSRGQLDQARRKGLRMSVALGDSGALPYRAETFDAVTSFELLAHPPSREAEYFEEAYRVLRPGGYLPPGPQHAIPSLQQPGRPPLLDGRQGHEESSDTALEHRVMARDPYPRLLDRAAGKGRIRGPYLRQKPRQDLAVPRRKEDKIGVKVYIVAAAAHHTGRVLHR